MDEVSFSVRGEIHPLLDTSESKIQGLVTSQVIIKPSQSAEQPQK